ncbi:DUF6771 family protein [Sphingomonas sp.]
MQRIREQAAYELACTICEAGRASPLDNRDQIPLPL